MANSAEISDCRFLLEFTTLSFNTHAIHYSFRASNFGAITGKNNFFQSGGVRVRGLVRPLGLNSSVKSLQ
jgi:hypothetical protein